MNNQLDIGLINHNSKLRMFNFQTCLNVVNDPKSEERLDKSECTICFYKANTSGWAMTQHSCKICGLDLIAKKQGIGRICLQCAKNNNLCKICLCDLEFKYRSNSQEESNIEILNAI